MQNPLYIAYLCYALSIAITIASIAKRLRRPQGRDCSPPAIVTSKWPFQLDLFLTAKRAMRQNRLMPLLQTWHEEYGDTFQTCVLGGTTIYTRDATNIKALLAKDFEKYELGPRNDILRPLIGHSIFTQDGKAWEFSRAFLRPHFAEPSLLDMRRSEKHIQALLRQVPDDVFDLQPLIVELIGNIAIEITCGEFSKDARDDFNAALSEAQAAIASSPQLSQYQGRLPLGKLPRILSRCQGFMMKAAIDALRCETRANGFVFAEAFASQCSDAVIIRDQMHSLVFAGRDTMVRLLSWTFWCLARHPLYFERLKSEIDTTFEGRAPDGDLLKDCRLLEWVIKEVLRLYPPISINVRHALMDTYLPTGGGPDGTERVFVPKGDAVNFSTFALQRRKDLYGRDADTFRPERWADAKLGHGYSYIPFSAGPRTCLGQKYAMRQCAYIITRMLQRIETLDFGTNLGDEVTYALTFSLGIGKGCMVKMKLQDATS